MAFNISDNKNKFTFTWLIENFAFSTHKEGEAFRSPTFVVNFLSSTKWYLLVFPKGDERMPRHLVGILYKHKEDDGPWSIPIRYELSLIGADGLPIESTGKEFYNAAKDRFCTTWLHTKRSLVLNENSTALPMNTLTICCRIWSYKGEMRESVQCYARTKIGIERWPFHKTVKIPKSLEPFRKITINVLNSSNGFQLLMNMYTSEGVSGEKKIYFEIVPNGINGEKICTCTLSILDSKGSTLISEKDEMHFKKHEGEQVWRIPLHVPWKVLIDSYLVEGNLLLQGECLVSSGNILLNAVEKTHCGPELCGSPALENKDSIPACSFGCGENAPSSARVDVPGEPEARNLTCDNSDYTFDDLTCDDSDYTFFQEMWRMRRKGELCDLKLKTRTSTFLVHKLVLCAKSLYFKELVEKLGESLECFRLEERRDTIYRLLLYVYTKSTDFDWDRATRLYSAAVKYKVDCLQSKCRQFLLDKLNHELDIGMAIELLVLSDINHDLEFKTATHDYIAKNENDIMRSVEWRLFESQEPKLAIEAFRYIHLIKNNKTLTT